MPARYGKAFLKPWFTLVASNIVLFGPGVMAVTNPKVAAANIKLRVSTYVSKQFFGLDFDVIT